MNNFSVKEKFEDDIKNIWSDPKYKLLEIIDRGFAIQEIILKNSIMFIGINPSFDESSTEIHKEFYNISQEGKSHRYFNKFKEISSKLNRTWTHFDLLFYRETNQKHVNELLKKPNGVDFIFKQLEISKKVILEAKPKILVVSNAMARHFLGFDKDKASNEGVWMDFDFDFDEELGTYKIINNPGLENTPVFFTSMLTGQTDLDKGSFERLVWHIKFALKQRTD